MSRKRGLNLRNLKDKNLLCVNKVHISFLVSEDDVQKIVSVCVDGKEAQMVFIDHAHSDMAVRKNPHYALHSYSICRFRL